MGNLSKADEAVLLLMAELRRSPVEVASLSRYLQGFSAIQTVVVWDFFHQQYEGSELSETSP